jgi:GTP cyclohydrolase IB
MLDLQNTSDTRKVALDQVGIKDLQYPITVLDKVQATQTTIGTFCLAVGLPQQFKGTHMSRFVEVLNKHRHTINLHTFPAILQEIRTQLHASSAYLEVTFPYFAEKIAPCSKASSMLGYQCTFIGSSKNQETEFTLRVEVPVTSLCPCSKAISDYGAHNQRGIVTIETTSIPDNHGEPTLIWIEDLISIAEQSASAPIYPLLKRTDERYVTMQAYNNPAFVEDIVRSIAVRLRTDTRVKTFTVEAVNHESIHNHNAFARVSETPTH